MNTRIERTLACFEPTFERFVVISEDSRLKIYDTRSGDLTQQLAEKDHLSIQYTAIAWSAPATSTGNKTKGNNKRAKKQSGGLIAVGTSKGGIALWDVQRGEVHKVLGSGKEGHSSKINGLVFTEGGSFVFSCSDDNQIIKWNIDNGEIVTKWKADNEAVTAIALSLDNGALATASTAIKMWDLASIKSQKKKFTGHASAVTSLDFSPDGKYLLSCSSSERYTSVWDLEADEPKAAAVFTATSNPVHAEFNRHASKPKYQCILALLRSGKLGIWQLHKNDDMDEDNAMESKKPDAVVKVGESANKEAGNKKQKKTKPGRVLFAQFTDKNEVLVVYGKIARPSFQRLNLIDETTGQLRRKIVIEDVVESLVADQPAQKKITKRAQSVLSANQMAPITKAGVVAEQSKKTEAVGTDNKTKQSAVTQLPPNMSLQEQLERMQLTEAKEEEDEDDQDEDEGAAAENVEADADEVLEEEVRNLVRMWGVDGKSSKKLRAHQVVPQATSLASALGQAIHTKDRHLLENVLKVSQHQIIFATVKRLQPDHVLPFLKLVLSRFQDNPNRSVALLVWIRAVLVEHVAYLSTVPALLTTLGELHSTVQTRLANHKRYVKLAGRLELLSSQIQQRKVRSVKRTVPVYREDEDDGEGGMTLMEAMDMAEEDDEDILQDEQDDDEEEIEDDGIEGEEEDGEDLDEDSDGELESGVPAPDHDDSDEGLEENGEVDSDDDDGGVDGADEDDEEDDEDD